MLDSAEFVRDSEPFRRELVAHCYRMLGSVHDAEDVVQETYVRAWRSYERFEGRSSVRTWLYQIATNRCLTELAGSRRRRVLPSGLSGPELDPSAAMHEAKSDGFWLQPLPDGLVTPESGDPGDIATIREGLRLALVASWQHLPPRQRAVLILRDVLEFPAAEVAAMLGVSTASVKSLLQRGRARLDELGLADSQITEPTDSQARAILDQYISAFETSDAEALERLLVADACIEATPLRNWFAGRSTCIAFLREHLLGSPGTWRMLPTSANGQAAVAAYIRDELGDYRAYGICVLSITPDGIGRISSFGDPTLVAVFGFPPTIPRAQRAESA
ncbi:MAG: polymerase, sigma-24 subunit, subfamily [Ilumatobacteraceae bacterium]|nr:polymerase, sigma-24 subunit, subfamily [Ilumatobacteraceae bacterium]